MAGQDRERLWAMSIRCVRCGSCERACRHRHGVARLRRPSHGQPVAFPEACQHCSDPACVEACIAGALRSEAAAGRVVLDDARCVGCWSCIMACPYAAVRRDLRGRPVSARCDRCDGYWGGPACVAACPTGALRCGGDAALGAAVARPGSPVVPLLMAAAYVVLPVVGLWLGLFGPAWVNEHNHALGIAAGSLMAAAFLLPLAGRLLWSVVGRAAWYRLHLCAGALGVTVAMAHGAGRFMLNAQTLAAASLLGLVLTGVVYRYLLPICRQFEAVSDLAADRWGASARAAATPRVAAAAAAVRQARAWARWLHRGAVVLAACRTVHVAWAIVATGLVVAHVLIMTVIGAK